VIRLILKARRWWGELAKGGINITTLAAREGVTNSYVTRVVRLAFLSPRVIDAALSGNMRAGVDGVTLVSSAGIPARWEDQANALLPLAPFLLKSDAGP
jgi:hypothetical protein